MDRSGTPTTAGDPQHPPLERYLALQSAAQGHSDWMARLGKYSHTGDHGESVSNRANSAGHGGYIGENILRCSARRDHKRLANKLVEAWIASRGHRKNILKRECWHIGIGIAADGKVYDTQNLGR